MRKKQIAVAESEAGRVRLMADVHDRLRRLRLRDARRAPELVQADIAAAAAFAAHARPIRRSPRR